MFRQISRLRVAALLVVTAGACSDVDEHAPRKLIITTRDLVATALGDSLSLQAAVLDGAGKPVAEAVVVWSSLDPAVASVAGASAIAVANGTARLVARSGALADTTSLTVRPTPATLTVTPATAALYAIGDSVVLSATALDRRGNPVTVVPTWTSSAEAVITVTAGGVAWARANGSTTITAQAQGLSADARLTVQQRPARLEFRTAPAAVLQAAPFAVTVGIVDRNGHSVLTAVDTVSLTGVGDLGGSRTVAASGGVATFTDLSLPTAGSGRRLSASARGLSGATSSPFDVHLAFVSISTAGLNTCGITADGSGYCWGEGTLGRVGDGGSITRTIPTRIQAPPLAQIASGSPESWALTRAGTLLRWGSNIPAPTAYPVDFTPVSVVIRWEPCALATDGGAYCWGTSVDCMGSGNSNSGASVTQPTLALGGRRVAAIATGIAFTCGILASDHTAWCGGNNNRGQLGNGNTDFASWATPVSGGLRFSAISAGDEFVCAISTSGPTYCWGYNQALQLGQPASVGQSTVPVELPGALAFAEISVAARHGCGRLADGRAYCWGENSYGQLGGSSSPGAIIRVGGVSADMRFSSVVSGAFHSCGIAVDGYTYCWGLNGNGQLGTGGTPSDATPRRVAPPAG